jgi:two-component system alkaline phosphatase synthesis response regulator PhoP
MHHNILLVEDEEALRMTLGDLLRSEGYAVDFAVDGDEGFEKAENLPYDIIILDVSLPNRNGFTACRDIRRAGLATPILMLTVRSRIGDKVKGLKLGADDYVTKPFDRQELLARVEALLRRAPMQQPSPSADFYQFGSIKVNRRGTAVTRNGQPVNLSAREFHLLQYFVDHAGDTLSRDELLKEVWGYTATIFTRTVDVHIAGLRQKLEDDPKQPRHIVTMKRLGYKFVR